MQDEQTFLLLPKLLTCDLDLKLLSLSGVTLSGEVCCLLTTLVDKISFDFQEIQSHPLAGNENCFAVIKYDSIQY
jgi:hypothetical protein